MSATAATTMPTRSDIEGCTLTATLNDAATRWQQLADQSEHTFDEHHANLVKTDWTGDGKDAAVNVAAAAVGVVGEHNRVIRNTATLAESAGADVQSARRAALQAITAAEDDGFRVNEDLTVRDSRRIDVEGMGSRGSALREHAEDIRWHAGRFAQTRALVNERLAANAAELDGIQFAGWGDGQDGTVQALDNETGERDARHPDGRERDPDGRDGRRERGDEIFRRQPGGKGNGNDWLDSDWAGRAILERYLYGNGRDWNIKDDPAWAKYMMEDGDLARSLDSHVRTQAEDALRAFRDGGRADARFSDQFHEEIENGESMTGYQYLHGTEETVGGFQMGGNTHVEALPGGNYKVTVDNQYTWNDVMDPNFKYSTDQFKDRIAQIISLGQAKPYDIHISWHAPTELIFDSNGALVNAKGYPYR